MQRLAFIRHARELGFEVAAIRTMLSLQDQPEGSCAAVDKIACARLSEIERRIACLTILKAEHERMLASCPHSQIADRRVIEALADRHPSQGQSGAA